MVDLQHFDLGIYHFTASIVGVVSALWLVKLSTHNRVGTNDKLCFQWASRLAYALIGVSMGWSAMFAVEQNWQPWPPFLLMCLAIDMRMITSIISVYVRERQSSPV